MIIRHTDPGADVEAGGAAAENATRLDHQAIVDAAKLHPSGANAPTPTESGPLLVLAFDHPNDVAFRVFKIKRNYTGNPSFHIHWTKVGDTDQSGEFARWNIEYQVFNGNGDEAISSTSTVETVDLEYLDSGTTTRHVYRSENLPVTGFAAGYYVAIKVSAATPTGTAITTPGLVSVDLIYETTINRGTE